MPFTPFHFGPGLLIKSTAPRRVSVVSYAAANVVIDLETFYHLVRHDSTVHQWAHTFLGAGLVGLAVGALLAAVASRTAGRPGRVAMTAFDGEIAAMPILLGALLGAIAHPLLDGLMHPDIHPFRPFSDANPLRGIVPVGVLEASCVIGGMLGAAVLLARRATWMAVACLLLMAPTATRIEIAANSPLRLGGMARALPDDDVVDLERVAASHGVAPWLISGPRGQFADTQSIEAFGEPTISTPALRRGPLVTLVRRRASLDAAWQPWTIDGRAEYAQVASAETFGWLEGDGDLNRPFRVTGRFTDGELRAVVALIRSSPAGPSASSAVPRVRGAWPILYMGRHGDGSVEVLLRAEEMAGQRVTLRSHDGTWMVADVKYSVL